MSYRGSYRELRRKNAHWPERMRDWKGRRVRVRRQITTNGGIVFEEGEVLHVSGAYRGRLDLCRPEHERDYVSQVGLYFVDLLPKSKVLR